MIDFVVGGDLTIDAGRVGQLQDGVHGREDRDQGADVHQDAGTTWVHHLLHVMERTGLTEPLATEHHNTLARRFSKSRAQPVRRTNRRGRNTQLNNRSRGAISTRNMPSASPADTSTATCSPLMTLTLLIA